MRVFVGTLESGEADFERCVDAIRTQDLGVQSMQHHCIISGRSERDAHRALYESWNAVKREFDLFLKVDADTVLSSPRTVASFIRLFEAEPRLTGVQAWLDDHMTSSLIYGLTCVSSRVTISTNVDPLFCDRVDTGHDMIIRGDSIRDPELSPAGLHCHFASDVQAFRYGLHRAKKNQRSIHDRVRSAWHAAGHDRIRGMVLLGFEAAATCREFDYSGANFKAAFERACSDVDELCRKADRE